MLVLMRRLNAEVSPGLLSLCADKLQTRTRLESRVLGEGRALFVELHS